MALCRSCKKSVSCSCQLTNGLCSTCLSKLNNPVPETTPQNPKP